MWRSPVRASAPFGLRRGAGANTVGVVVVVALVVIAHFAPRPPSACNWRCHLLPPLLLPCVQHLTQYSSRFALYPSVRRVLTVATATACSENCLCVTDAQVLPGCSNRA